MRADGTTETNLTDINAKDESGKTALILASETGDIAAITFLLSHPDIDVSKKADMGDTALTCAANNRHTEAIRLLLEHPHIVVNEKTSKGRTALMLAAANGNIEAIELLLTHPQIDINIKDRLFGCDTARRQALYTRHLNIYFLLLDREEYRNKPISYEMLLLAGQLDLHEGASFISTIYRLPALSLGKLIKLVMKFMDNNYAFLDYSEALSLAFGNYDNLFMKKDVTFNRFFRIKSPNNLYDELSSNISKVPAAICRFSMLDNPTNLGKILQIEDKKDGYYGLKEHICSYLSGHKPDPAAKEHLLQNLEPVTAASFAPRSSTVTTSLGNGAASADNGNSCVIS